MLLFQFANKWLTGRISPAVSGQESETEQSGEGWLKYILLYKVQHMFIEKRLLVETYIFIQRLTT